MNIWVEGAPGTGKTTLAKALAEALGVEPLHHVTHERLPDGRPYNVIDKHAVITNTVYKQALPKRFKDWLEISGEMGIANDLYVLLRYDSFRDHQASAYTKDELKELDRMYALLLTLDTWVRGNLVIIHADGDELEFFDYVTDPIYTRRICIRDGFEVDPEVAVEVKVREILKIVREMEYRHASHGGK